MRELYDPAQHRPLTGAAWSDQAARAAIEAIAADAIGAYQGPERLWPNAPEDLEDGDADRPYRNVYLGAAGVAWALDLLAREQLTPELPGMAELADGLPSAFHRDPELTEFEPPPVRSLPFGESGVRLAVASINMEAADLDALRASILANVNHPSLEFCWGSPGTMLAAFELWRVTGHERWGQAWIDSATWLIEQWHEPIWVQDLYGKRVSYTGAGHGFAGNAFALLAGLDLIPDRAALVTARATSTLHELAVARDGLAQWPPEAGVENGRWPVQWCHGSPGIVISLARLPNEERTDRLLLAGGELTWRAGPLRKGVGLCHGTAGNAYALLSLHARTGDQRWLERARCFAMDAIADVERRRAARGRGRYTLFTGDLAVALLLRSCIRAEPAFPFLERALESH